MKIKTDQNEDPNINPDTNLEDISISPADVDAQHRRDDKIILHRIKKYCFYVGGIFAGLYVIVWLCNILLPQRFRWLTTDEITNLQNISLYILTGVLSALVSNYFFRK